MGASLPRLFTMRASALVLLALASAYGDSDPYTVGQVAYGATYGGVVTGIDYGYGHVAGYGAIGNRGFYGKREADSEPYTLGQVALGLPVHNAYATGHPHNVGVVTGTTYSAPVHHGYTAYAAPAYTHAAYGVHAYATPAIHGYAGHYYGKREADSDADAYTIGQVAAGLPVHNAYATGHPHNVGVVTGTTYS